MELNNQVENQVVKNDRINPTDAFICVKCNFSANSPSIWLAHSKTIKHQNNMSDADKIKEYRCECCNLTFKYIQHWNKHVSSEKHKRQGKPKSISCVECDRTFINHITRRHHMLSVHSTKEERAKEKYYCDICDYVFISKLYMDKHIQGKFHNSKIKALESYKLMQQK
jgi:hypothetical protein